MSYQVIARKWRPQTFEEVTGQEVVTQTLRNALEHDRLHHAYIFSGARGVGKTTTARLLAKALNCHKTDKPNLTPCSPTDADACPSCIEIAESRSMDVLEIDAASHTGIDDVRGTIIDGINFSPARDRFKVFIIDEVHQLSKQAFNALLKTLEEPPPNVVFVMATTELHKVPETILSRCQEFEFRTIALQKIFARLKFIADAEKIDISDDALRELARSGDGSMRDAQSNFDQVISFSGEKIGADDVTHALGLAGVDVLKGVASALINRDGRQMLGMVEDLTARGHDFRSFCRDILGLFRDLMVLKVAGDSPELLESAVLGIDEMREIATGFTESDLLRFFNSLCETETKLKEATQSRYVLEIGLMKLIEMRRVESIESLLERLAAIEGSAPATPKPQTMTAVVPSEKKTLINQPVEKVVAVPFADEPVMAAPEELFEPPAAETPRFAEPSPARISATMSSISREELEHIDDVPLDSAYDDALMFSGDNLAPIASVAKLAESLFGKPAVAAAPVTSAYSNGHSTAAARAPAPISAMPDAVTDDETAELPELAADPTEEELLVYANAHPLVKRAAKVFRGKVVGVKRI